MKLTTSPLTVVPVIVAVVVEEAVVCWTSAGVVLSLAEQCQPVGAVRPVAPFIVITTAQDPVVPDVYVPAVAPPVVADTEHPVVVNFVPFEITPFAFIPAAVKVPVTVGLAPNEVRLDAVTAEASVAPVNPLAGTADAVIAVLHPNPVALVHFKALDAVEHDGTASAVGATAVRAPSTELAVIAVVSVPAVAALRFATCVVDATVNGAVPVDTVD